jgi:predicted homoserine dehydrogenase-like protein
VNLHQLLRRRAADGNPVRVALIGAGRFGTMFLSQLRTTPGLHAVGIADLNVDRAHDQLHRIGWTDADLAPDVDTALAHGTTVITTDARALIEAPVDIVIEATGNPETGIDHALRTIAAGHHIVMVNVEADALAGPALAQRARQAGVVYSLAYGDQPAMIWELVDWARTCGFEVVCAGKGTKYLPEFLTLNPDTVWSAWAEFSEELTSSGQVNPYMHTSFRDGTKAAIEMAAVANAATLRPADDGLAFPPATTAELATVCRPRSDGGTLQHSGTVEVVSSVDLEGNWLPNHIQEGVFVVVRAPNDYTSGCFGEYLWHADDTHRYIAMYKPFHLIGMELGITIAHVALNGVPTGAPEAFCADVVAVAKTPLRSGSVLDGEGGFAVRGKLVPAAESVRLGALPIGLAHFPLIRDVAAGEVVTWDDVEVRADPQVLQLREETTKLTRS